MDRGIYNEDHEIFRAAFRRYLDREVAPHLEQWEADRETPRSAWKGLGEQGYLCPWLPEKYGGYISGRKTGNSARWEYPRCGIGSCRPLRF